MKKWIIPIICVICALYLILTNIWTHNGDIYISIGTTYNKFLFIPAKSAHFTIRFKSQYTGSLTLVDDKQQPLPSSEYKIEIDGMNSGPSFFVKNKKTVDVSIRCAATVSAGKHYVQVKGGGPLITHVYFTHHLNPLIVWILWILTAFAIIILIWFILLRPMMISRFKIGRIVVTDPYFSSIRIHRARRLIFTSKQKKDNIFAKIFLGRTIYSINPVWTDDLLVIPGLKKGVKAITKGKYTIDPYAANLQSGNDYTITHNDTNQQIKITVN